MVGRGVLIGDGELVGRLGGGEGGGERVASADETFQRKSGGIPGSKNQAAGSSGTDKLDRVGEAGGKKAVSLELINVV